MTNNKLGRRKESDAVWRRMYLLAKIEGAKAELMRDLIKLPPEQGAKEIDAMVAQRFAVKAKTARVAKAKV